MAAKKIVKSQNVSATLRNLAGEFVTVETYDGDVYVGTLDLVDGDVQVLAGLAGRPVTLDESDVIEVLRVDKSNPHVEYVR